MANESTGAVGITPDQATPIPGDALIIVPVRNMVLFPGVVVPITIGRPKSIAAAQLSPTASARTVTRAPNSRRKWSVS